MAKEDVIISVSGKVFDGWESVSITKNLESIANTFSISLFDRFEELRQNWLLKPGVGIEVDVDIERVVTGRIESVNVGFTQDVHDFIIAGRSKAGDLIDSMHVGPSEYKNISLTRLAEELVKPFGLGVFESVIPSKIDKFVIVPGETIFEALDRAARAQGLFFISTREGNIRLTRAARARSSTSLEQNVNLLSARAIYDDSKRHNEYIVRGQTSGVLEFFGEKSVQAEGRATDLGIKRHRPFIMIAEGSVDSTKAKIRAQWEASTRLGKAIRVTAVVQGWTQKDGSLWGINQVMPFTSRILGLNRDLLSVSINHTGSAGIAKTTTIVLTDPEAYNPEPEKNKKTKEDIFASLGAGFAS